MLDNMKTSDLCIESLKNLSKRKFEARGAVKTYRKPNELRSRLAKKISEFRSLINFDTDEAVPSLVLRLSKSKSSYIVEYIDTLVETEGISMTAVSKRFDIRRDYGVIGYDIEYVSSTETLLSHQFCFADPDLRFGLLLETDIRFTDSEFEAFLSAILQAIYGTVYSSSNNERYLKKWYIFAHNSIAEGSWIDSSQLKIIGREGKRWYGTNTIYQVEDVKKDGTSRCLNRRDKLTGILEPIGPKIENVTVRYCDTMGYFTMSLDAACKQVGLEKLTLLPEKHKDKPWFRSSSQKVYGNMDVFAKRRPERFRRYSMRDAIVTATMPIIIHSKMYEHAGISFSDRMAKYSEKATASFIKETFGGLYDHPQKMLGQQHIWTKLENGKMTKKWEPGRFQKFVLQNAYHGGRNDCKVSGCYETEVVYHDMTSAYPSAIAALPTDYDFSTATEYTRGSGLIEGQIKSLMRHGPFQPHLLAMYVRFKEGCVPMAPHNTDAGIVFPTESDGIVMCWPEYWTAKKLGIIEEEFIYKFYKFKALDSRHWPLRTLGMIKKRKDDPLLYKNLLNYEYGKLAQGATSDKPFSSISCPALAAYITSATRAAAGELANLNPEYAAITTDGFLAFTDTLKFGAINKLFTQILKTADKDWIKPEFKGDMAVFWKTRGYILYDSTQPEDAPPSKRFKQAKMGVQGETPADFIGQVKNGKGLRRSAKTFSKLEDGEIFHFLEKEFKINPSYDWKFVIKSETLEERTIEIDGVCLTMPCFETRPLKSTAEFFTMRQLAQRRAEHNFDSYGHSQLSTEDYKDVLTTCAQNSRTVQHVVWEFRKRLARAVDWKKTNLTYARHKSWATKALYDIPQIHGPIKGFNWILKREAEIIKDRELRKRIKKLVFAQMEKCRSTLSPNLLQFEIENFDAAPSIPGGPDTILGKF